VLRAARRLLAGLEEDRRVAAIECRDIVLAVLEQAPEPGPRVPMSFAPMMSFAPIDK
jgi:hypothetical protein